MTTHTAGAVLAATLLTFAALPAHAQNWTGAYVGASATSNSGTNTDYENRIAIPSYTRSGTMRNLFAGYLIQDDSLVYGAEISRSTGALRMSDPYERNHVSDYTTLTGKVGYAQDNALYSAGLGYFQGTLKPVCIVACGVANLSGIAMSLGVDVFITDNMTIGGAVIRRTFDLASYEKLTMYGTSGNDTAFELRVGYNF